MRTINDNRVRSETHTHPIIVAINSHSKSIQNPFKILWKSYENPMKWWWNPDLRYSTIMASMAVASTCGASPWPPLLARTLGKCWGNGLKNTVWNMLGEMDSNHLKPENVETIISFQDFPGISSQLCQLSPNFVVLAHHWPPAPDVLRSSIAWVWWWRFCGATPPCWCCPHGKILWDDGYHCHTL